MWWLSNVGSAA